jgi:coproporphyrinogen III oxidase-like Fe-S oxidoreductase
VNGAIYANTFSLHEYVRAIQAGRFPIRHSKGFSRHEMARYYFLMNLFGLKLDFASFRERFGCSAWRLIGPELLFFIMAGALRITPGQMYLTDRGRYYWVIMSEGVLHRGGQLRDASREAVGL